MPHGFPLLPGRSVVLGVFLQKGRELMPPLVVALVLDEEERQPEVFAPLCPERIRQLRPLVEEGLQGKQRALRQGVLADDVPARRRPDPVSQIVGAPHGAGEQGSLSRAPEVVDPRLDETPGVVGLVLPAGVSAVQSPELIRPFQGHIGMEPAVLPLRPGDDVDDRVQPFVQRRIVPHRQKIGNASDDLADQPVIPGRPRVTAPLSPGHPLVVLDCPVRQKFFKDVRNGDSADFLQIRGEKRVRDLHLPDIRRNRPGRRAQNGAHGVPPPMSSLRLQSRMSQTSVPSRSFTGMKIGTSFLVSVALLGEWMDRYVCPSVSVKSMPWPPS